MSKLALIVMLTCNPGFITKCKYEKTLFGTWQMNCYCVTVGN